MRVMPSPVVANPGRAGPQPLKTALVLSSYALALAASGCAGENAASEAGTGGSGELSPERRAPGATGSSAEGRAEPGSTDEASTTSRASAPGAHELIVPEGTRSLRLKRSIAVRAAPRPEAERVGTVARDIRVSWKAAAEGEGCDGLWIELEPRGWVCDRYVEPSQRPPWGVEMPRLGYGEVVPGVYGKVVADDARTVRQTEDGLVVAHRALNGSVMVRRYEEVTLPSLRQPRPEESAPEGDGSDLDAVEVESGDDGDDDGFDPDEHVAPPTRAGSSPIQAEPELRVASGPPAAHWLIDKREREYLPAKAIREFRPSTFQGVRLGDETGRTLPLGFPLSRRRVDDRVPVYSAAEGGRVVRRLAPRVPLAVLEIARDGAGDARAYRVGEGQWVRAHEMRLAVASDPPSLLEPHERWFDIDVEQQVLVAYEGALPVYTTLVSTGTRKNPTETGVYRMWIKFAETDMKDLASESPYSVATVPWTQFFAKDLALHTAYWHDTFGTPRSHGCINLAPLDARFLYFWSDPQVPPGWSMANADVTYPGSLVRVRSKSDPEPPLRGYAERVHEARRNDNPA